MFTVECNEYTTKHHTFTEAVRTAQRVGLAQCKTARVFDADGVLVYEY